MLAMQCLFCSGALRQAQDLPNGLDDLRGTPLAGKDLVQISGIGIQACTRLDFTGQPFLREPFAQKFRLYAQAKGREFARIHK